MSTAAELAAMETERARAYQEAQGDKKRTGNPKKPKLNLYSASQSKFPYEHYHVETDYKLNHGKLMVPNADLDGETAIIQVSAPYGKKVVVWAVIRRGDLPELPAPVEDDTQELLYEEHRIVGRNIEGDGKTEIFEASGFYVFGLRAPARREDGLPQPQPPFLSNEAREYKSTDFVEGIVN